MVLAQPEYNIGHNSGDCVLTIEVRLFNSLSSYDGHGSMEVKAGTSIGDILNRCGIPSSEVFLVLVNGRDITPHINGGPRLGFTVDGGDVVAFSGPVPYGWGYGSPVV